MSSVHTELLEQHRAIMPSWLSLYYEEPIELVRGEVRRVWDAEGRQYLDFFGGILTTMTAHALPEMVATQPHQPELNPLQGPLLEAAVTAPTAVGAPAARSGGR